MLIDEKLDAKTYGERKSGIEGINDQAESRSWMDILPIEDDDDDDPDPDFNNHSPLAPAQTPSGTIGAILPASSIPECGYSDLTDEEVLAKLYGSNDSERFKSFWAGKYESPEDQGAEDANYYDAAAGSILARLAYVTNKDADQMERIFRGSPLFALNQTRWEQPDHLGRTLKSRIRGAIRVCDSDSPYKKSRSSGTSSANDSLVITTLSQVTMKPLTWLVPGYVPLGKMLLLAGDGGDGKSLTTIDLIASVTRGRPALGLDYKAPAPASALLISCEDDVADTVVPRLAAAGADLDRVHHLEGVRGEDGKLKQFNLKQYDLLARELEQKPDIRLIVIDPAGAYIGGAGIDDYNDSDLRAVLSPMCDLAAKKNVAVVLVKHFSKAPTVKAVNKVLGSVGYVNAVRAGFVAVRDHDDPTRRFFLPIKFNLGEAPKGLSYTIEAVTDKHEQEEIFSRVKHEEGGVFDNLAGQLPRIKWLGEIDITADEAVAQAGRSRSGSPTRIEQCKDWLKEFLKDFAYPSDEVVEAAKKAGFTYDNVKEARGKLKEGGLKSTNKGKCQGTWWTGFGEPESWRRRPDVSSSPLPQAEAQPLAETPSPPETPRQTGTSQEVVPSGPSA